LNEKKEMYCSKMLCNLQGVSNLCCPTARCKETATHLGKT
jgi:hypothetical protein